MSELHYAYSEPESTLWGLRTARASCAQPTSELVPKLRQTMWEQNLDVLRLRLQGHYSELWPLLEQLGCPWYISSITARYWFHNRTTPWLDFQKDDISFVRCDARFFDVLDQLATDTFDAAPQSHYQLPLFHALVSSQQELAALKAYLRSMVHTTGQEVWLVRKREEWAAVLALDIKGDTMDCTLAGIRPAFRGVGIFEDIIRFIYNRGRELSLLWGHTGARIQDIASQKYLARLGGKLRNYDTVLMLMPLLGYRPAQGLQYPERLLLPSAEEMGTGMKLHCSRWQPTEALSFVSYQLNGSHYIAHGMDALGQPVLSWYQFIP